MNHLHPMAVWIFFGQTIKNFSYVLLLLAALFIISLVLFFSFTQLAVVALPFALLFAFPVGLSFFWALLSYANYKYGLTPEGFKKEYGVLSKKYVTIPYDSIQNVDIHRTFLDRILGLSDLQIQTAGTPGKFGGEGRVPGLGPKKATEISTELVARSQGEVASDSWDK